MKIKIDFSQLDSETIKKIWDNNKKFQSEIRAIYRDNLLQDINNYMHTLIKGGSCYWELDAYDNCTISVSDAHIFAEDCMDMVNTYGVIDIYEATKLKTLVQADKLLDYDEMDIIGDMIEEQVKKIRELIESAVEDELHIIYDDNVVLDWYEEVWCNEIFDATQQDYYIDDGFILYEMVEKCYK